MDDAQLLRYSRQVLLADIDLAGQERLLASRVLIIGLGGLGAAAGLYLAAAGVGRLLLADGDRVELSNLQRQIVHFDADIGRPKVESAADKLRAINPDVRVEEIAAMLAGEALDRAVGAVDLVVDASDNFAARFAINAACVRARRPLVIGAALRFEGQITTCVPGDDHPCYRCLYDDDASAEERCEQAGVIAPLLGVIGSAQALEALKVIAGFGTPLIGRLLVFDALTMRWRTLGYRRDPACPACQTTPGA